MINAYCVGWLASVVSNSPYCVNCAKLLFTIVYSFVRCLALTHVIA